MKKIVAVLSAGVMLAIGWGCAPKERYLNLATGEPVQLVQDEKTGVMIDKETKRPVYIYVDTKTHDTIYGKTGEVINGHVVVNGDKEYVFDGDEKLKTGNDGSVEYKDGDYKVKIEKDGDMKVKNGDRKTKTDGETDEKKVKKD
ncbi:MAG: hypothetical protein ABIT05_10910 [Chitinophagaceae bacterium]